MSGVFSKGNQPKTLVYSTIKTMATEQDIDIRPLEKFEVYKNDGLSDKLSHVADDDIDHSITSFELYNKSFDENDDDLKETTEFDIEGYLTEVKENPEVPKTVSKDVHEVAKTEAINDPHATKTAVAVKEEDKVDLEEAKIEVTKKACDDDDPLNE